MLIGIPQAHAERYLFFPIIFGSPDTGLAGGGMLLQRFDDKPKDGDQIRYLGFLTTKKQYALFMTPSFGFGDNNQYRIVSNVKLLYFPSKYSGLGNDTKRDKYGKFTLDEQSVSITGLWRVYQDFSIGLSTGIEQNKLSAIENNNLSSTDAKRQLPQEKRLINTLDPSDLKFTLHSIGTQVQWDSRDIPAYPSAGGLYAFHRNQFADSKGNPADFIIHQIDLRQYVTVADSHIVAMQFFGQQLEGSHYSIFNLPRLGGTSLLRGYGSGRFRDKALITLQADYRIRFNKSWGMGIFIGAGKVASSFKGLKDEQFHHALGVGGYYVIDPVGLTALRFDLAAAESSLSPYVHFDHSF